MQWQAGFPFWGVPPVIGFSLLGVMVVWSLIWKAMALWRAAQRREMAWFVALLLVNTAGILEILYWYVFSKEKRVEKIDVAE